MRKTPTHTVAVLQALFVTLLWSSSWVLIRIGLVDIPALTFAGLRYSLAFICTLPFFFRAGQLSVVRRISLKSWLSLLALGVLYYTITQGTLFVGLELLPAVSVSLLLNLTPIVVAILGIIYLHERLTGLGWAGVLLSIIGSGLYYLPFVYTSGIELGYVVVIAGMLANAASSVLGRGINRRGDIPPLTVTVVSMGFGSLIMLAGGLLFQGLPDLGIRHWALILWLAVISTALAFTLWNHTLRTLTATESSVINNTLLIQISVLAYLFLGETLTWKEIAGLVVAGIGALLVQVRRDRRPHTLNTTRSTS
jgi:drug/metabolite transporter (DMT)-like permease